MFRKSWAPLCQAKHNDRPIETRDRLDFGFDSTRTSICYRDDHLFTWFTVTKQIKMVPSPNPIPYPRIEVLSKLLTHLDFPKSHQNVHFVKWKMYFRYCQVNIQSILHLNLVLQSWKVKSILSWSLRSIRIPMVQDRILQKSKNISKNMEHQMCMADQHNDQALRNGFDLWLSNRLEDNHQDGKNIFYFFLIYSNFLDRVILSQKFNY